MVQPCSFGACPVHGVDELCIGQNNCSTQRMQAITTILCQSVLSQTNCPIQRIKPVTPILWSHIRQHVATEGPVRVALGASHKQSGSVANTAGTLRVQREGMLEQLSSFVLIVQHQIMEACKVCQDSSVRRVHGKSLGIEVLSSPIRRQQKRMIIRR